MKKLTTLLLLLVSTTSLISAQTLSKKIEKAYVAFENDTQLKYGISSLSVLNAETGEVIFSKNEGVGLAPASTLKTITSATAFYLLGPSYTYQTTLGYSGNVSNGVLNGDLIITGSGDPTLGSVRYAQNQEQAVLKNWLAAINKVGIKKITGRVIANDDLFGTQSLPIGWIWQDIGNYYGAGAVALSWRENQFQLNFKPGNKVGESVILSSTEPQLPNLKIINEVLTGEAGSGDNVYVYSAPYTNTIYIRGTYGIDLKKAVMASLPDPGLEAALTLADQLKKVGIVIENTATTSRILKSENKSALLPDKIIATQVSPSLDKIIYWLNQKSLNLYAENLLRTVSAQQTKKGTTEDGVLVMKDFWNKKAGIDKLSMKLLDGSGLAPENRISTLTMARILQTVKKEPWFNSYLESFPLYNNTKMKSGSINGVLAYTGYQTSSSGTPLVFSFITNNYNGSTSGIKQKMFRVLDVLK